MQCKSIVFDLDHTIGYFKQFIYILNHIGMDKINESYHFLFDLFPEFFRPNIFDLFKYLIQKRKEKKIKMIILYTNNNNDIFVKKITDYMNDKLNTILFDIIITYSHPKRKYKYKDYNELLECSELNDKERICFIDDKKHINMLNDSIFYIQCEPYLNVINSREVYNRTKVDIPNDDKGGYMLNLNNQRRVTEQILNRIKWFISS